MPDHKMIPDRHKGNATGSINKYLKDNLEDKFEGLFGSGLNSQQFRELKKRLGSNDYTLAGFCANDTVKKVTDPQWGLADTRMVRRASFTGQDSDDEEFIGHASPIEKEQVTAIEGFIRATGATGASTNYIAATIFVNYMDADDEMRQISHMIPRIWLSGYMEPVYGKNDHVKIDKDGVPVLASQEMRIKDFTNKNRKKFKDNQLSNITIASDVLAFTPSLHAHSEVAFAADDLGPLFEAGFSGLAPKIGTAKLVNCTMYLYSYPNVVCTNLCRQAVKIAFTDQFVPALDAFVKKNSKTVRVSRSFQSNIRISSHQEFQSAQNRGLSALAKDTRDKGAANFPREGVLKEQGKTYEVMPPHAQAPAKKRKRVAKKGATKSDKYAKRADAEEAKAEEIDTSESDVSEAESDTE